jgi:hypothetical protein
MPKGNIIDLEKSELTLVKIKQYAKLIGKDLKTNQEIVDFGLKISDVWIEEYYFDNPIMKK